MDREYAKEDVGFISATITPVRAFTEQRRAEADVDFVIPTLYKIKQFYATICAGVMGHLGSDFTKRLIKWPLKTYKR